MQSHERKSLVEEFDSLTREGKEADGWDNERCNKWDLAVQSNLKALKIQTGLLFDFQTAGSAGGHNTGIVGDQRTGPPLTDHQTRVKAQVRVLEEKIRPTL